MSKPLAGKRYFYALGERTKARYPRVRVETAVKLAGMARVPLWARNAFVDGLFGVGLRRRPAWAERDYPDYTLAA